MFDFDVAPRPSRRRRLRVPSALDLLNATVSARGVSEVRGLPYGPSERHTMDVYRLHNTRNAPMVVFFHGGAWRTGSREEYRFMGIALARMGFVGVIADYRHFPEVTFPGFLADAARATVAARARAVPLGADPARIVLFGHSAGAYIAAMLALDPSWLSAAGMRREALAGWVGLAGPYDFLPMTGADVREVFGAMADSAESQPIRFADGAGPPACLIHGLDDRVVYPSNTVSLAARIRGGGGAVREVLHRNTGHVDILLAFAPLFRRRDGIASEVGTFIDTLAPVGGQSRPSSRSSAAMTGGRDSAPDAAGLRERSAGADSGVR